MSEPLINILIRTSNQPNLFSRCIRSVDQQSYKNIRVIVSYDQDIDYLPSNVETIRVERGEGKFFYNDYCNVLKSMVTEGYFFFLDTDDFLEHSNVLSFLSHHLQQHGEDKAYIVQMFRNNKPKPNNYYMDRRQIGSGHIGLPCLVLHSKYKDVATLGVNNDNDDYRYIAEVVKKVEPVFIPLVVVGTDRRSHGMQIDIKRVQ